MAFVRQKGNKFYLVHNVRRGEKIRQIHLARLGEHAQITERVVREVFQEAPLRGAQLASAARASKRARSGSREFGFASGTKASGRITRTEFGTRGYVSADSPDF